MDLHDELTLTNAGLPEIKTFSMTVKDLELKIASHFPLSDGEEWDVNGLIVGDPRAHITGVAIALDPTIQTIQATIDSGANVLLTHHPLFLNPPRRFLLDDHFGSLSGHCVALALSRGISLMNFHTCLDVNSAVANLYSGCLNLRLIKYLSPRSLDENKGYAILCSTDEDESINTLKQLASRTAAVFETTPKIWGKIDNLIDSVAICNGSAGDFVQTCISSQVDCLICGEVRYHDALNAYQHGLSIIELGHDVSEYPLCALLAQTVHAEGVPQERISIINQRNKWTYQDSINL